MNALDYTIVAGYLLGMLYLGYYFRRNADATDFFLGNKSFGWFAAGLSVMATNLSAIAFIGVPAFVGARADGGLFWVSGEIHAPITMLVLMTVVVPPLYRSGVISIYSFLESRFGNGVRRLIGFIFLVNRAMASAMIIYGVALLLEEILGIDFWLALGFIGGITLIYSGQGGMRAVVYGDAIQIGLLFVGMLVVGFIAASQWGSAAEWLAAVPAERTVAVLPDRLGINGDGDYGFWPFLIGGLFISVAYYGTDQSEAQRFLSVRDLPTLRRTLLFVGLIRYPFLLIYAVLGLLIGPLLFQNPEYATALTAEPDRMMPIFLNDYVPHGILGLIIVAMIAAAMSSLSSAINSLSAVTVEDYPFLLPKNVDKLRAGRLVSFVWGAVCLAVASIAGDIDDNLVVAMAMIGSVGYGPILAVFLLCVFDRRAHTSGALVGLLAGVVLNLVLAIFFKDELFWIWWNVTGLVTSVAVGWWCSRLLPGVPRPLHTLGRPDWSALRSWEAVVLLGWFVLVLWVSFQWEAWLGG